MHDATMQPAAFIAAGCIVSNLQRLCGEDHVEVAATCNKLGDVYFFSGAYAQAVECHEEALAILVKRLGEDHWDLVPRALSLERTPKSGVDAVLRQSEVGCGVGVVKPS